LLINRIKYLFVILLLLTSCYRSQEADQLKEKIKTGEEAWAPIWAPPEAPHFYYPPSPEIMVKHENNILPQPKRNIPQPKARRDTIEGIAVRVPGSISIVKETPELSKIDSVSQAYYAISYISTNSYFSVNFDNDIFSNTDYYYTNGIQFELVAPIFASSPFAWPMLPYRKESINYHGLTIVQNMYTPTNPDTISVIDGDRPFAAYLYIGHTKNTLSIERTYRQYSEIIIGLIGPGSLGGFVQSQIHNVEPVGWQNQIQNDLLLNYTAEFEKGIVNPAYFDLNIFGGAMIGTLYDNAYAGLRVRAGRLNPYFSMPGLAKQKSAEGKNTLDYQIGLTGSAILKAVAYDATLQGGLFNNTSQYTIPGQDIENLVINASLGLFFAYKQLGIKYEHNYISPEFKDAKHHQWGHINITYCF
jgi:hypothetical protein